MGEDCISPSAPFRLLDADRDDAVHRRDAPAVGRQAGRLQALHRPRMGVPGDLQGDAGDRHLSRLHRRRRQGRRHRRGAAGIHRPYRHADARGPALRAQRAGRHRRCATASSSAPPARSSPPSTSPAPWRSAPTGATRRAASCSRVGCIQSQSCHTDRCPTGVATQDPHAPARAGRAATRSSASPTSTARPCTRWPR